MGSLASRIVLFALLLALPQAGCSRGPDESVLVAALQQRLDDGFDAGLFAIRTLRRRGSAPFRDLQTGSQGLFLYYDAELEFLRDYALTSWSGLNLGTLAFVLGATEQGVVGFASQGNRAGDALLVSGRLTFRETDAGWSPVDDVVPPAPKTVAPAAPPGGAGPAAVLRSVRELLQRQPAAARPPREAAIIDELERASARIDLRFADLNGAVVLGTGQPPGTYHDFGVALAQHAKTHDLLLHSYASEGSVENGFRLQTHHLDFGLIQSDVAETLFRGWVEERQLPQPDLRSVASLWPEAVHIVTLEDSGIETLNDLRGRRVALGEPGSGSRFNALRIGSAAGFVPREFGELTEMRLRDSIRDLEAGRVDALFVTEAIPSPGIQNLALRRRDVRFIEIDADLIDRLAGEHFAYYPLTVPARTYPGQAAPFRTLGLAALMLAHRRTPNAEVEQMLELLVDGAQAISKEYYRAGFISSRTMRLGIAVPLHPAAERFYAERAERDAAKPPESEAAERPGSEPADPPERDPGASGNMQTR